MQLIHKKARDLARISNINTFKDSSAWVDVELLTKIISRIVSRDFHIISIYMYLSRGDKFKKIATAIQELETQIFYEHQELKSIDIPIKLPVQYKALINLRLISPYAARYYKCLVNLDGIFYQMIEAEFNKKMNHKTRKDKMKYLLDTANLVKKLAMTNDYKS